ncbi:hypothetical protein RND81_01G025900 [Saponaria officinalis]|uniref:WEB family protein n=1 Tax=Saponaria officinalis TaxID=3572 RepID=A0AAW1NFR6_SAPOF
MAKVETLEIGEIDTSAPFESVMEAVTKFGVLGFWKPHIVSSNSSSLASDGEEFDVAKVEAQAAELEKELILKERDTLEVLKELEATKVMIEQLKSALQKEEASVKLNISDDLFDKKSSLRSEDEEGEEKENNPNLSRQNLTESSNRLAPGVILTELKQAKWNLTKTTNDLAEIRASVELYNKKIERERASLEKTRERLKSSTSIISSLEESKNATSGDMVEIQRLNNEAEKYNKIGEAAKSEVVKVMLQIEETKAKIKTNEIRLVAARKMKDAARAAESVALAEIKALEKTNNISSGFLEEDVENVTLTNDEYSLLRSKARDAEGFSNLEVLEAVRRVDEANDSKVDIMKRVEEAMDEVKMSKKALEDALNRVEAANSAKLVVEEALQKSRFENGEKRRSIQNNTKFKNSYPSYRRRDSWMLDLNGVNLVNEATSTVLRPTLSIGQILSRKLLISEEFESGKISGKRKISLGQMLGKPRGELSSAWKVEKEGGDHKKLPVKRKKFGFSRFSILVPTQSQKKKPTADTR